MFRLHVYIIIIYIIIRVYDYKSVIYKLYIYIISNHKSIDIQNIHVLIKILNYA